MSFPHNVAAPFDVRQTDGPIRLTDNEAAPSAGSQVGRYLFLREIAQGPFGPLYEARTETDDGALPALVRVMVLPKGLADAEEQGIAQAAWDSIEIGHDGVLRVADAVFGTGWLALVHDHSEGSALSSLRLRAEERHIAFPVGVAIRIALDILASLEQGQACCESLGLEWCAGSVAATSLYLCGDGRTRLLDGQVVAAALKWEPLRAVTGAIAYCAPETLDPRLVCDERSDVFSVGVVIWELITGKQLLPGDSADVALKLIEEIPSAALSMPAGSRMPRGLPQVLRTALALEPAKRFATRAEFASALSKTVDLVAGYDKVIEFTDVLLRRASTLFRLDQAPQPVLSKKLSSDRPKDRARPRPPRARGEPVPRATIPRRPMVLVGSPDAVSDGDKNDVLQQQPGQSPAEKAAELKTRFAKLRETLIGVPGTMTSHHPTLIGGTGPEATAPSPPAPDAGSARTMTLLGLKDDVAGNGQASPAVPAEAPAFDAEGAVMPMATEPSEPPTTIMAASKLAQIAALATQNTTVSLAESFSSKPAVAPASNAEPTAGSMSQATKPAKRTVVVGVTTLVLGFVATILCVVVIMLLLERTGSSPSTESDPTARQATARAETTVPPSLANKTSAAAQLSAAPHDGSTAEASAANMPPPKDSASPESTASAPALAPSQDTAAAKPARAASPQPAVRRKAKKRYVPSDL